MSKMGASAQKKEAVEVQEDCLGWEEQVHYRKRTFFLNAFLTIPKQKLKIPSSKSDWIFLPYFLPEMIYFVLTSLTAKAFSLSL